MSKDQPVDRRRFFRQGLRELFKPLQKAIDPLERVARELGAMSAQEPAGPGPFKPPPSTWHRPPGALPERQFLDTCSRCGDCVDVCPARCIRIDPLGAAGGGAPHIDVDTMPCVLCSGLECMRHCPTGALVPTPLNEIDMGTARWREETCLRTKGEDCTICVDHCPVGAFALEVLDGKIHVKEEGCTGCGVCQHRCPTQPKSIVVIPKAARPAGG